MDKRTDINNASCSFLEEQPLHASAIISGEASVASTVCASPTMFFAISPVPAASSSTVLFVTTGRISRYSASYAA